MFCIGIPVCGSTSTSSTTTISRTTSTTSTIATTSTTRPGISNSCCMCSSITHVFSGTGVTCVPGCVCSCIIDMGQLVYNCSARRLTEIPTCVLSEATSLYVTISQDLSFFIQLFALFKGPQLQRTCFIERHLCTIRKANSASPGRQLHGRSSHRVVLDEHIAGKSVSLGLALYW